MMMIIIIIMQLEPFQNYSDSTCATYQESMKLKNYKKTAILGIAHVLWKVLM